VGNRVSVSTEPRPAELPLPGGQSGATVRLHPLLVGEILVPPDLIERAPGRFPILRAMRRKRDAWVWLPVPAFLVEHPGAGALLIDTGLHPSVAFDPTQNLGRIGRRFFDFRMTSEQAASEQLRARGIDPADVRVVAMTHLHTDHASAVSEFPRATFVVDRREWDAAIARGGLLRGYRPAQFDYGFDWRTIDYEAREIDSFATFGPSVDLFGDGSVRLLSTPGHSAGHQSVLLQLKGREALLTADAAYERRTIDQRVRPLFMADEHRFWRSLNEIRRYVESSPEALVITGHDRHAWPQLQPVYE
jgi:glyoxylase-like metal-dependent hydrolase (beta-lactamase superfamily II)